MTHFNKGPSYGLSAEVKNKVRAAQGSRGFVCTGTAGRDGMGRDAARGSAASGCRRESRPPRAMEAARMRPPPARDSAALRSTAQETCGHPRAVSAGRTRVRSRDSRGRPGCTCPCRQPWHGTFRPCLLRPPGPGGARRWGPQPSQRRRSGEAGRRARRGRAGPGAGGAVLCGAVRSGARGGAQRSGRCADRGPPRGAFQAHDIMGTGGARPMGAGPAQTRIVRPLRSAPPRPRGRTKAARLRPDPRPAGSPAGTERPGPPPRRQLRLKAAEKAALTASSRAPRPERRAPVVRGFAEVLLILLGTKGVSRCAVRLAATLQRIIT